MIASAMQHLVEAFSSTLTNIWAQEIHPVLFATLLVVSDGAVERTMAQLSGDGFTPVGFSIGTETTLCRPFTDVSQGS